MNVSRSIRFLLGMHLLIVALGSGIINIHGRVWDACITRYCSWTGGGFGYSFFSPNVGNQTVVKTYTVDAQRHIYQDAFGTGDDIAGSRISSVIHTLGNHHAYELLSRMLVSNLYKKYPEANGVYVCIGEFVPPSAKQFRLKTAKDNFREVFTGTFVYNPSLQNGQ
jgi:hypothetical protein